MHFACCRQILSIHTPELLLCCILNLLPLYFGIHFCLHFPLSIMALLVCALSIFRYRCLLAWSHLECKYSKHNVVRTPSPSACYGVLTWCFGVPLAAVAFGVCHLVCFVIQEGLPAIVFSCGGRVTAPVCAQALRTGDSAGAVYCSRTQGVCVVLGCPALLGLGRVPCERE